MYLFYYIFLSIQERDWAISASPEARVLCETGHEGHPHWPAHDLYTAYCLYGQLHEKVSALLHSNILFPSYIHPPAPKIQQFFTPSAISKPYTSVLCH